MIISVLVFSECLGLLLGPEPNNEVIKSPKFGRLIVFAPFLIIIIIIIIILILLFLFLFLSADRELVHGRSQELQDRIS